MKHLAKIDGYVRAGWFWSLCGHLVRHGQCGAPTSRFLVPGADCPDCWRHYRGGSHWVAGGGE